MRRAPAAALAAAAALAVGCGGSGGSAAPRATVQRYFAALAAGRGAAACAELTDRSRQLIADAAKTLRSGPGCPAAMEAVVRSRFGARLGALRHPRITSLVVDGDQATARVDGVDAPLKLTRLDGAWRIEFSPSSETD